MPAANPASDRKRRRSSDPSSKPPKVRSKPGTAPPLRGRHPSAWQDVVLSSNEQYSLKRNAVLRAAARAFSARGYHETSLDDVARALGVTKPALYYYVKNKQEILFECHMISHDLGNQALAFAQENGRTAREQVVLLARRYIELITGELGSFGVLSEFDALNEANRGIIATRRDHFEHVFRDLMAAGVRDGSIRAVDPKMTVFFFMGAVNWMTRWFRPDGASTGGEIAAQFSDLLEAAIRPDG